ncbi:hypothetical protein HY641_00490, partial [Candidatus Woesearchaeota archaeon]|nr:hypothetical protein [Candidatus Woesearchaeota archaeon]
NLIFQRADRMDAVVMSTMNKNEHFIGTQTELFSGHIAPLKHLYKSEVIDLAKEMGLTRTSAFGARTGCADYWFDDEIFGVNNEIVSALLYLFCEKRYTSAEISRKFAIPNSNWLKLFEKRVHFQKYRLDTQSLGV